MLRWALGLVIALGVIGCKFPELPPIDEGDGRDETRDDSGVDAGPCPGELFGYAISNIAECDLAPPDGDLDLTLVASIDTFAGTMTSQGGSVAALPGSRLVPQAVGPMLRVVSVATFELPQNVTIPIRGEYPIAFIVWGDATVAGTLSLTGSAGPTGVPAGRRSDCGTGSGTAGTGGGAGGGGGGGGLGTAGGTGGIGSDILASRGDSGTPLVNPMRSPLWGGCAGSAGSSGALPGSGGGALQMSIAGTLTLTGTLTAGGGGGAGGGTGGGAGGGSGGMLLLEAGTAVTGDGSVTANGGGGGGGAGTSTAGSGLAGCAACSSAALGGSSGGGGAGGNGGAASIAATGGGNSNQYGGGGGGGGVGLVWVRAPAIDLTGTLSPLPRTSSL